MEAVLTQPYERLVQTLSNFAASMQASQPAGPTAPRWQRAANLLHQELDHLHAFAPPTQPAGAPAAPDTPAMAGVANRLTQLARTLDGLRFEHSTGAPAAQLRDEQRMVVFAAWQLQQALEHGREHGREQVREQARDHAREQAAQPAPGAAR